MLAICIISDPFRVLFRAELYVLKAKCFEQLCDFKSAIANLRKAIRIRPGLLVPEMRSSLLNCLVFGPANVSPSAHLVPPPENESWLKELAFVVDAQVCTWVFASSTPRVLTRTVLQGQSNIRHLKTNCVQGARPACSPPAVNLSTHLAHMSDTHKLLLAEALSYFTEAITIDEGHALYWLHRSVTYIRLQQWRLALADINQYILLEDTNSQSSNADSTSKRIQKSGLLEPDAMKQMKHSVANCDAFVMRAKLHWRLDMVAMAQADLDRAHYLNPEHQEVQFLKRIIGRQNERIHQVTSRLILGGKLQAALKELTGALKLNPGDVQMLLLRAAVYRKLNQQVPFATPSTHRNKSARAHKHMDREGIHTA